MPYIQFPLSDIDGVLNINNRTDRMIKLMPFSASVDDIGIDGSGYINLTTNQMDILFHLKDLILMDQLMSIFPALNIPYVDAQSKLSINVVGAKRTPKIITKINTDHMMVYGVDVGHVAMDVILDKKSFSVYSDDTSSVYIDGGISSDGEMDLQFMRPDFDVAFLDRSITVNVHVRGKKKKMEMDAIFSDLDVHLYGLSTDQISLSVLYDVQDNMLHFDDIVMDLNNGQQLLFKGSGGLGDGKFELNQVFKPLV